MSKQTLVDEITFLHPVKMPLTDKEVIAYADELAGLDTTQKEATLRHDGEKGTFKAEIKGIQENQERILNLLRVKEEYKEVECIKEFDYFEGIVVIKRSDNGSTVVTRKMTPEEFRRELPFSEQLDDDDK